MPDHDEELVTHLHDEAGEYLRAAAHYTEDDYEVLYMRDDVMATYPDPKLEDVFDYWRDRNRKREGHPFTLGSLNCTIQFFDEALLFHFTQGDRVGTVVTLEPEAGRDVLGFITRTLEQLHRHTPHDIEEAPDWLRD